MVQRMIEGASNDEVSEGRGEVVNREIKSVA
jgi:hypothetical protein